MFISHKADTPEWRQELTRVAHGDMFPDDWRYRMISECADDLAVYDPENWEDNIMTIADSLVDVYTRDLLNWLGSRLDRFCYFDDAQEEGYVPDDADIMTRIKIGQFKEHEEILQHLVIGLGKLAESEDAS